MKRVFLDTNILLDYLFDRDEFAKDAQAILALGQRGSLTLCISALTFANIAYIARHKYKGTSLYELLGCVRKIAEIAPIGESAIDGALKLKAHDFEDALQYQCAVSAGCDCIVTRNMRDFGFAQVALYTPKEFLAVSGGGVV